MRVVQVLLYWVSSCDQKLSRHWNLWQHVKMEKLFKTIIFISFFGTLLAAPSSVPNLSKHPVVLIVSFDGFRSDYLTKTPTPHLTALMEEGVSVPYMSAQFPTKTFPNHHSMATGLYPDVHGITDNTVFDPLHNKRLSGFNDDPEFWNYHPDVLPFWVGNLNYDNLDRIE